MGVVVHNQMLDVRKSAIIDKALIHLILHGIGPVDQNREYALDDRYFDIGSSASDQDIPNGQERYKDREDTKQQDKRKAQEDLGFAR